MKLKMKMKVFGNYIVMHPGEAQIPLSVIQKQKCNLNILTLINKVWIILHWFSS